MVLAAAVLPFRVTASALSPRRATFGSARSAIGTVFRRSHSTTGARSAGTGPLRARGLNAHDTRAFRRSVASGLPLASSSRRPSVTVASVSAMPCRDFGAM